jgi:hypothetical protein
MTATLSPGVTWYTPPDDREARITRVVDAPCHPQAMR